MSSRPFSFTFNLTVPLNMRVAAAAGVAAWVALRHSALLPPRYASLDWLTLGAGRSSSGQSPMLTDVKVFNLGIASVVEARGATSEPLRIFCFRRVVVPPRDVNRASKVD